MKKKILIVSDNIYTTKDAVYYAENYFYMHELFGYIKEQTEKIKVYGKIRGYQKVSNWQYVPTNNWFSFIHGPDFRGLRDWIKEFKTHYNILKNEVKDSNVVVIKLFSLNSLLAFYFAKKYKKTIITELVGDPADAFEAKFFKNNYKFIGKVLKKVMYLCIKKVVTDSHLFWPVSKPLANKYGTRQERIVIANESRVKESEFYLRPVLNKPLNKIKILFVGRLEEVKGIEVLVEAVNILQNQYNKEVELTIIGGGSLEQKLKEQSKLYGLNVQFLGIIPYGPDLFKYYRDSDIFVLPSYSEGTPLVIIESMANSLPVIASNVGGIPNLLSNNENGFLFDPGNAVELVDAIIKLSSDVNVYNKVFKNAYNFALENSAENQRRKVVNAILEVI